MTTHHCAYCGFNGPVEETYSLAQAATIWTCPRCGHLHRYGDYERWIFEEVLRA